MSRLGPLAGAVALGALAARSAPAMAPIVPGVARALGVPCTADGSPGVALTFDDGPHPQGTPAVLEALAAAGARATFFLVGEQVEREPALTAEIAAAGHEIALHGHRHRLLLRLPRSAIAADLDRAAAIIGEVSGRTPQLHRPPYGIYSRAGLAAVRDAGWRPLLWSAWGRDWRRSATAASITDLVCRDLRPGAVLLLHDADWYSSRDSWRATAAAVPRILERVAAAGLEPVPAA